MKLVMLVLFGLVCLLSGCAGPLRSTPPVAPGAAGSVKSPVLWEPCDLARAEHLGLAAGQDSAAALQGAACYAYLVERGGGDLDAARAGRKLAEQAVAAFPDRAVAHYLLGYLAGLEAERSPLHALALVPDIEREALAALAIDPGLDQGGPPRMLGDLYLRAPAFPVSVGDAALAVEYFRQAVALAPGFADNRLGLAESLLVEEETAEACEQLLSLWQSLAPGEDPPAVWQRILELQRRVCESLNEK